jgi:aryl-alcohol dehydrogenase-like predicted oxidoreductase
MNDWQTTTLGKTGWKVFRLGLASSYGADERCVQVAFERGVNYLYWGSMRTAKFGAGLRSLKSRRDEFHLVIQSYARVAAMVPWSLERALRSLGMEYADLLLLGLWNKDVSSSVFDHALELRERGLIRKIAVSTHNRPHAADLANNNSEVDVLHVRYNAVHPGAERDIFPKLTAPEVRPGIVTFTATCWGDLMKPDKVPVGDRVPTAGDCYRFNLTNPAVDLCLMGPRSISDLTAALETIEKGPMTAEEMDWMRRVGQAKYEKPRLLSIKG